MNKIINQLKIYIKPIPLTLGTVIVKPCWISFTKPTQSPTKATQQKSVMVLRNWKSISVTSLWKITTQSLTSVAVSAVLMIVKPSSTVFNMDSI